MARNTNVDSRESSTSNMNSVLKKEINACGKELMMEIDIYSNESLSPTIQKSQGTIDACKKCSGFDCCGIVKESGIIEPPFLSKYDITQIECHTGLTKDQFAVQRKNPVTGNLIFIMKTDEKEGCIFFNRNKGKCEIYSFRPVDCRIFPLDCRVFSPDSDNDDNQYYWALYNFKQCSGLSKRDLSSLMEYKEIVRNILGDEMHDFATYPLPEMERIGFKKLLRLDLSAMAGNERNSNNERS